VSALGSPKRARQHIVASLTFVLSGFPAFANGPPDGVVVLQAPSKDAVWATFNRDGSLVAANNGFSDVTVWETATGRISVRLPSSQHVQNGGPQLSASTPIAFSPGGKFVASGTQGQAGIIVWDLTRGNQKRAFKGQGDIELSLAFSPDGKRLAAGNGNDTLTLWELNSGREMTVHGHDGSVIALAFSRDGKRLATGSRDGTVKLWSIPGLEFEASFKAHAGSVTSVTLESGGKFLVSSHWQKAAGTPLLDPAGSARTIIWDLATGREKARLDGVAEPVLSDDGRFMATVAVPNLTRVDVWETSTAHRKLSHEFARGLRVFALKFWSQSTLLAVAEDSHTSQLKLLWIPLDLQDDR
jgi:WD40 repeat protein